MWGRDLGAEGEARDQRLFGALGIALAVVVIGTLSALGVVILGRSAEPPATAGASPEAPGLPTLTPDLPDLRIARGFSRENELWVEIVNAGVADAATEISISAGDEAPVVLLRGSNEPLAPGEAFEAPIPGEYIQRRGEVMLALLVDPPIEQETEEGKTWTGVVTPDLPNDLEILGAAPTAPGNHLRVTVRNNSPIPVRGTITITVRETLPSTTLLGRESTYVELAPGGTAHVEFEEIVGVAIAGILATLSTDAIDDDEIGNNSYPR